MAETKMAWYVMFYNHTQGLKLNQLLREQGIANTIVPTPRKLSKSCGISLLIDAADLARVEALIAAHGVEILEIASLTSDINPARDQYC